MHADSRRIVGHSEVKDFQVARLLSGGIGEDHNQLENPQIEHLVK